MAWCKSPITGNTVDGESPSQARDNNGNNDSNGDNPVTTLTNTLSRAATRTGDCSKTELRAVACRAPGIDIARVAGPPPPPARGLREVSFHCKDRVNLSTSGESVKSPSVED
ncbi:hypothetical protein EVAR_80550_1 [Eumeta japonica]|uniref:Uncharacterized protein n=1 Tax=Eumeta variegata TaxID=151549 RepID=A0A4C1TMN3_EUMVA|nr:hypothetical protein EVAR_80550_1 [Eumeta japonica]